MKILLDSDVVIEVLRGWNEEIFARWSALSRTHLPILYSPVTAAEIWAGARPPEFASIQAFFPALTCIPMDHSIGEMAGSFMRQYRKSHAVELADALIAATAVHQQAALLTRNRKHFPMPEVSFYC